MASETPGDSSYEAPFDPLKFPSDLPDLQKELHQTYSELHRFAKTLPWPLESHSGINDTDRWRNVVRPATEGAAPQDAAEYERLRQDLRRLAALVNGHRHCAKCGAGDGLMKARQGLKHAPGAIPAKEGIEVVEAA
ncbi:hypothetical protein [Streptomyces mirabilis]